MRAGRVLLIDVLLVAIATVLALVLRNNFDISWPQMVALAPYGAISLCAAAVIFVLCGVNRGVWRFTSMRDYLVIVLAVLATVMVALALGFSVNRLEGVARALPVLQGLLAATLLIGARVLVRLGHRPRRQSAAAATPAAPVETVLIVGVNKRAELYLHCVAEFASDRVRIAGLLDDSHRVGLALLSHRVLAPPEQIAETVRRLEVHGVSVDRILLATPFEGLSRQAQQALRTIAETTTIKLEQLDQAIGFGHPAPASGPVADGIDATASPQLFSFSADDIAALTTSPYWRFKRLVDGVAALSLLVILAPLMILVGVLVALDVGLPVMFWQQRPGLGGRPFRLYKFRTMGAAHDARGRRRSDAERVSRIGAFLRRTRLDELPQLVSILRGEMSFVGPRPLLPVDQSAEYAARLLVRPGLTGWAQVKGGRTIAAVDKAALDVWYVRHLSLALDVKIVLATVPMVVFGERVIEAAIERAWHDLSTAGVCAPGGLTVGVV